MSATNAAFAMPGLSTNANQHQVGTENRCNFQMPLHYPRYMKRDYETMPEWKVDCLLKEYGLPLIGDVNQKRKFAMGAFLWHFQDE
ncbi:Cytoplasmic tRNA 2-thiolation protein 1 [Melia azedarach]|uniref:Cytoplasmic tRNA 2-thiolation protein 1 n=1 Tax=Melia azedarach TaxID=155640 RepID=A0ACC1XNR5_MELAZ|nr:Cytoplasmic tRNA 2-thiolation protein 1 [Melia azedarach]